MDVQLFVYLDTETTGLSASRGDTIVEVSIIDNKRNTLIDTLVNPNREIPFYAINVHGITDEMVRNVPNLPKLLPEINTIIEGKILVIYNSNFDTQFFLDRLSKSKDIFCAMSSYSKFLGNKKWIKLIDAAKDVGHVWEGNAHRALADAKACRSVWKYINI